MFSSGAHSLPLDATGAVVCTFKRRGQLCNGAPSATSLRTRSQPPGTYGRLVRRKVHREDAGATHIRIQRRSQAARIQRRSQAAPIQRPSQAASQPAGAQKQTHAALHRTNRRWQTLISKVVEARGYRLSISGPPRNCVLLFASCKKTRVWAYKSQIIGGLGL